MLLREGKTLANIGKLPLQWKIIFDFNPRGLLEASTWSQTMIVIREHSARKFGSLSYDPEGVLSLRLEAVASLLESDQLPRTPEWSRIEITYEEREVVELVESTCFVPILSLSVNGREPTRWESRWNCYRHSARNIDDMKIVAYPQQDEWEHREGFEHPLIRGLVVLGKQ